MKSTVNNGPCKDKPIECPCLMLHEVTGSVFLMSRPSEGFKVFSGSGRMAHLGKTHDSSADLVPFTGSVCLENDKE